MSTKTTLLIQAIDLRPRFAKILSVCDSTEYSIAGAAVPSAVPDVDAGGAVGIYNDQQAGGAKGFKIGGSQDNRNVLA